MSQLVARLEVTRGMVEEVVLLLADLPPRVDRTPVVTLLDHALSLLGRAAQAPIDAGDHLDTVLAAGASILGAATILTAGSPDLALARDAGRRLRRIKRELDRYRQDAIEEIAARPIVPAAPVLPPAEAPRDFIASRGVPALHHLDRGPLAPLVRVDPRFDVLDDGDDAEARLARGPSYHLPRYDLSAGRFITQLRGHARECFEELGMLGGLRSPNDEVPWSPAHAHFEGRLLADLDAAVALADPVMFDGARSLRLDVLRELLVWAADAFTVDPGRAFARAFILGCVEGEDRVRAAVLALRQSSPLTHDAELDAFALASSPAITPAMEALALGEDARLSALALGVLRDRREGSVAIAGPLVAHPDAGVRRAAAELLGAAREREAAVALLDSLIDLDQAERVRAAAAESLVRLGIKRGLTCARSWLLAAPPADADAASTLRRILAMAGSAADLDLLLPALAEGGRLADVPWIGWHGHTGAIEPLLVAIEELPMRVWNEERRAALADAVERITGEPVDPTEEGVAAYRRWWRESQARFGPRVGAQRFRRGSPYSPLQSLDELAAVAPARDREALALELAAVTRGAARLRTGDWVARQLGEIQATREALAADEQRHPGGTWPADHLG